MPTFLGLLITGESEEWAQGLSLYPIKQGESRAPVLIIYMLASL